MHVVMVKLVVSGGNAETFRTLVLENARLSRDLEPGCVRFDVCWSPAEPERFVLYEIYQSEAAFEAHLVMAHYLDFSRRVEAMVVEKTVEAFELLNMD